MTAAELQKLIDKVEMLEAKASILLDESRDIKKMLLDVVDPDNKRLQASILRRQQKAEEKAALEAVVKLRVEKYFARMQTNYALQQESKAPKYQTDKEYVDAISKAAVEKRNQFINKKAAAAAKKRGE